MRECPSCGRLFNDAEESCPDDECTLVPMGEADPLIGTSVGNYHLTKRIGRGGMGSVYVGEHPAIGSTVAIKVLHRKYAGDPAMVERFFNEARAVNLIGHENIVRIFDFGHQPDGTPWFVMELLQGRALSALCGTPHPAGEVVPIFLQIAEALGAAHAAGVVHRDLKPENVFLVDSARGPLVKVLDFGIAKLTRSPGTVHTSTGAVLGSARYMSPEQASGDSAQTSARTDVYSFGVLLFELTCGRVPFEGTTYGDLLIAHRTQPPPRPSTLAPGTPLEPVILQCLEKAPEDRFASMAEVIAELGNPKATSTSPRRSRRWPWLLGAAPVAAALALVLRGGQRPVASPRITPEEEHVEVSPTPAVAPVLRPIELKPAPVRDEPIAPLTNDHSPEVAVRAAPDLERDSSKPPVHRRIEKHAPAAAPPPPAANEPRYTIPSEVGDGMVEVEW